MFWIYFYYFSVRYSTLLCLPPLRYSTVLEDAGIEPRTVATLALAVRHSNHSARSHPPTKTWQRSFVSTLYTERVGQCFVSLSV
jgi:hypothetical protein